MLSKILPDIYHLLFQVSSHCFCFTYISYSAEYYCSHSNCYSCAFLYFFCRKLHPFWLHLISIKNGNYENYESGKQSNVCCFCYVLPCTLHHNYFLFLILFNNSLQNNLNCSLVCGFISELSCRTIITLYIKQEFLFKFHGICRTVEHFIFFSFF